MRRNIVLGQRGPKAFLHLRHRGMFWADFRYRHSGGIISAQAERIDRKKRSIAWQFAF